jgi:hypothetical protein
MAVIVLITAIGYPTLDSMYGYFKVTAAADTVKGAWARARGKAIEDGIAYRFSVVPERSRFRIAPDRADFWNGEGTPDMDPDHPMLVLEGRLPKGIRFNMGSGGQFSDLPEDDSGKDDDTTPGTGEYTTAAVFLPDGTAQDDLQIRFDVKGTRPITLKLRAMTGTVKTIYGEEDR